MLFFHTHCVDLDYFQLSVMSHADQLNKCHKIDH